MKSVKLKKKKNRCQAFDTDHVTGNPKLYNHDTREQTPLNAAQSLGANEPQNDAAS